MKNESAKIAISIEADQGLDRMVKITNDGFSGGRVTKNDLTSWAVLYFETHTFRKCIETIRRQHFDEVTYLDSIVREMRKARKNGQDSPDIKNFLAALKSKPKKAAPSAMKPILTHSIPPQPT